MNTSTDLRFRLAACLVALVVATLPGAVQAQGTVPLATISGQTMGTTYTIRIPAELVEEGPSTEQLQADVDELLSEINRRMSTYDRESELSRFNDSSSTDWFPVSEMTVTVTRRALEIAELSGGAFDPTVAPLIRLWHFDRDRGEPSVPPDDQIRDAFALVGYQQIEIRDDPPALRKSQAGVELNLSAIAKGYGVDAIAELLDGREITAYMVELGGEVRTRGTKSDGTAWRIGIEQPLYNVIGRELEAALELSDASLATSGDYRNSFLSGNQRYSHTIDPQTGRPVTHSLTSVTVVADDCMTADALATALMVLGPEKGSRFAEEHNIASWMLVRDGQQLIPIASTAFEAGPGQTLQVRPDGAVAAANGKPADPFPWTTVLLAVTVFALAMLGLAAGVILRGKKLAGTCGGLAGLRDRSGRPMCDSCTVPAEQCEEFRRQVTAPASAESDDPA